MIIDMGEMFDIIKCDIIPELKPGVSSRVCKYIEFLGLGIIYHAVYDNHIETDAGVARIQDIISSHIEEYVMHYIDYSEGHSHVSEEIHNYHGDDIIDTLLVDDTLCSPDDIDDKVIAVNGPFEDEILYTRRDVLKFCDDLAVDVCECIIDMNVVSMSSYYKIAKEIRRLYTNYFDHGVTLSTNAYVSVPTRSLIIDR